MFKISFLNIVIKEEKNMTNHCYCYRGYDIYRVGADPVKLNQQFYCRKRIIRNRLFHKGRLYWTGYDVLREIHEIYRTMDDTAHRIHRIMHRIMRFMRIVCKVAKLEAPILAAFTALYVKALYCCALIAILN